MPRISTYTKDVTIVDEDLVLGSNYVRTYNGIKEYNTRSFKLEDLALYFNTKFTSAAIDTNSITATEINISGNGTDGQFIMSDGDGSFSYLTILDEDNMSSNSATTPASQQSIKAYVDSQIATEDTIAELNDTTIGTLANAHLLIYDNDSSVWENKALSGDATITKDGVISLASSHTNIDSILNASLAVGRDADNQIKYSTDNQIIFRVNGGDNVIFKASGEIEATSLDISGDIDIDGTTNLDAVDIDGAVQIDNTVTVGVDDTGYDVKFFGDTSGKYTMWDTSQDALLFSDNAYAYFGNDADLRIWHNAGDSGYIQNYTNDLYIQNNAADKDIKFYSDDGNGGLFEYFSLDGSEATYTASATTAAYTIFPDKSRIALGVGKDLQIYHDGSNSYISESGTGGLVLDASGISGTAIKDEDNMASDSATHLATQQSIKAYVDAQVDTEDTLAELDDTNISSAAAGQILVYDNTASVWDNVALTAGDLIDVTGGDGTLEIDVDLTEAAEAAIANGDYMLFLDGGATGTPKKEALHDIATLFSGTGLTATNSVIAVDAAQTQITSVGTLAAGAISSGFGNIDNGSSTFNTGAATVDSLSVSDGNITNVGDIALDTISADGTTINVAMTDNTDGAFSVKQGSDKYIAIDTTDTGEDIAIGTGVSGTAITIGHTTSETTVQDNLTVTGNLKVNGDQVYQNVSSMAVTDPIISLQTGTDGANLGADSNKDVGLAMFWHNGSAAKTAFLGFDDSAGKLTFIPDASISSEVVSGSVGIMVANLEGNVTGDVTGTSSLVTVTDSTANTDFPVVFNNESNGLLDDTGAFEYNPSTGTLIVANLDIGTNVDVDGTLEADVLTVDGTNILTGGIITSLGTIAQDTVTFTSANANDPLVIIQNTTNDATAAALRFNKNRGADAQDNDMLGRIDFYGYDDGTPSTQHYGQIGVSVKDASSGAEGGEMFLGVANHDGGMENGLVLSDGSADGEIDVTIGSGTSSVTTIAGDASVTGAANITGLLTCSATGDNTISTSSTAKLLIQSSGANGNDVHLGLKSSDTTWLLKTNRGDQISGNQGDFFIREDTAGVNALILETNNGNATFAGNVAVGFQSNKFIGSSAGNGLYFDGTGNYGMAVNSTLGLGLIFESDGGSAKDFFIGTGNSDPDSATKLLTITQAGNATFAGNVAVGGGTHPSYHGNVTSALTLDDEASVFTRGDEIYIGNNFYYGASDAGLAIETGKATVIRLARDEFNLYFAASASAGASSSLSEKFKVDESGNATFAGYVGTGGHTPDCGLEVYGADNTGAKIKITNTSGTDNEWSMYANYNSQDLIFLADSTEVFRLQQAGPHATLTGANSTRNTYTNTLVINGGTTVAHPYPPFGFGIHFQGDDYSDEQRNYASIRTIMENSHTSTSDVGDPSFRSYLSFWTNSGGADSTDITEKLRITGSGCLNTGTGSLGQVAYQLRVDADVDNGVYVSAGSSSSNHSFYVENAAGSAELFAIRGDGQVRIGATNGVNVLFATTAVPSASVAGLCLTGTNSGQISSSGSATTAYNHFLFYNGNGLVGYISTSSSTTTYSTSSDYRMKEDLKDFNGLDLLSKMKVYDFKWKSDDTRSYGSIAHEIQEIIPSAVVGEKDGEEMQGLDYSQLVPILLKSIQELEARVKEFENK